MLDKFIINGIMSYILIKEFYMKRFLSVLVPCVVIVAVLVAVISALLLFKVSVFVIIPVVVIVFNYMVFATDNLYGYVNMFLNKKQKMLSIFVPVFYIIIATIKIVKMVSK